MKLRFNGFVEKRTHGCHVCGHKATSDSVFVNRKTYFLPSGSVLHAQVNTEYEVADVDAEFLLDYSYTDSKGIVHHVFEGV